MDIGHVRKLKLNFRIFLWTYVPLVAKLPTSFFLYLSKGHRFNHRETKENMRKLGNSLKKKMDLTFF